MELLKTDGVVLSRTFVGEKDAIIKILTTEAGLVTASVKGIKNMKSKLGAGCAVFSYSDLLLRPGKSMYTVTQSVQKEGFYGLSSNIERLSFASYFAELISAFSPSEEDAKALLPLLLNALYLLSNTNKSMALVKCVFELKLLGNLGFLPELFACTACGDVEKLSFFSASAGGTVCRACGAVYDATIVSEDTLLAMRYVQEADNKKAFSFALSDEGLLEFSRATETMIEHVLMRLPKSLSYLKQIMGCR